MNHLTKLLFATFFYLFLCLPIQSFSASNNSIEIINISPETVISEQKGKSIKIFKPILKISKWFKKWEAKHSKPNDGGDDIGNWTWTSIVLAGLSLILPPFGIAAVITSMIALQKNKKDENLGDLDRTLALTTLIVGILLSLLTILFAGIIALGFIDF